MGTETLIVKRMRLIFGNWPKKTGYGRTHITEEDLFGILKLLLCSFL